MDHPWREAIRSFEGARAMRVSVSDAKGQLTELVRRAEAGDEVILTRRGYDAVRLVAVAKTKSSIKVSVSGDFESRLRTPRIVLRRRTTSARLRNLPLAKQKRLCSGRPLQGFRRASSAFARC